jgi:hypothetical protein
MRRKAQESFVGLQNLCRHYSHIVMGLRTPVLLFAAKLVLSDVRADLLDEVPQQARDELAGGQIVVKSENGLKNQALNEAKVTVRAIALEAERRGATSS